jgi:uncharacterized membrane protein YeaQ/YmgE (transglycosylase-associated protein family)
MGIFAWIIVGLIAGSLAQTVTGKERRGCTYTLVIGVLGALIGGALFNAAGTSNALTGLNFGSIFVAFIGGCALCLVLNVIDRR